MISAMRQWQVIPKQVVFRHYPKQLRHDITLQADHAVSF
jgi:hypothetical protein